jgi:hypothetical protein
MDFQATEEAFSPQTRTSSTSKHEIYNFFIFLWFFCPPGSGYGPTDLIENGSNRHNTVPIERRQIRNEQGLVIERISWQFGIKNLS